MEFFSRHLRKLATLAAFTVALTLPHSVKGFGSYSPGRVDALSSLSGYQNKSRGTNLPLWGGHIESNDTEPLSLQSKNTHSHFNAKNILSIGALISAIALAGPSVVNALPVADIAANGLGANAGAFIEKVAGTGFYQAFSLVFVSEIGDKTFFIAGILAAKTSKLISFVGSIGALAVMTVLSVVIGQVFNAVPSGITQGLPIDDYVAVAAFAFFGLKTIKEAWDIDEGNSIMDEELADAEEAVESSNNIMDASTGAQILSIFGLVFAAEFGDRSFLSTIALSAAQNPFSVAAGAVAAHAIATGIAVLGGAYLAQNISEKVIGYVGGALFLVFAATTAYGVF
mmetsp:Transcript_57125/g.66763  ORF Transcript_57125/g.66763 Transcript_57125/m.66763 type:complete len:341 (-) Transcript_57125:244-1266(-)|eukprot:CAMPEP_0194391412 /NCGR_PEP_ID=MMETSP0174-20130528/115480_1 /TAXON_ID=216777 /ORGANISM="Proboscia alata, Strain PI-D3" /LENGTH=340 /DNA_ID=CAMNT_0039185711 /DNA_START=49 /DNA_END=1071 /DNA_ORIENTATION=-